MIGKTQTISKWIRIASSSLLLVSEVVATSALPPDKRSWEEVTADFINRTGEGFNRTDGHRLKELDPKRAVEFLMSYLAKDKPERLRLEAIGALGCEAFQEAVPALSAIAKDVSESEGVRARALNPGLRYMKSSVALETAASVATDKSRFVRTSAYCVLSDLRTDQALNILETRIQSKGLSNFELAELICALWGTAIPRAGQIILSNCDFSTLPDDEDLLGKYSLAMEHFRIPDAQPTMLRIARKADCNFSTYYALRYFSSFPREDAVPALVAFVNGRGPYATANIFETVTAFSESPVITEKSKNTLRGFLTTGKVKKEVPIQRPASEDSE